jgi:cyclopropane fatty-acyl-phospholipid synthase-like methyltransferase
MDNSKHYDFITEAWSYLLGENFHWGLFTSDTDTLNVATYNLINKMLSLIKIDENKKIIDIGCGIGTSAIFISKKYNCIVYGISNSKKGIEIAVQNSYKNNVSDKVKFFIKDVLNNDFSDNYFDIAWLMEMAHLIQDKQSLIKEAYRILKPKGEFIFCDLIFKRYLKPIEILNLRNELQMLDRVFGKAVIETLKYYTNILNNVGFKNIETYDISENVIKTLDFWKENAIKYKNEVAILTSENYVNEFIFSCDLLKKFYTDKIWGYGIIKAVK